jgi:hypothetical protein
MTVFTACLLHLLHWWIQPRASALGFFLGQDGRSR